MRARLSHKEVILLCLAELWEAVCTDGFLTSYEGHQLGCALQQLHRKFVYKVGDKQAN